MKTRELTVLSLHPDPANPLGLDLKHILSAFDRNIEDWVWCVKNLDWLGDNGESLCQAVEAAGPRGFWIDSRELLKEVDGIYQTIEGEFLAFPKSIDQRNLGPLDLGLASFPTSHAIIAVVAVDGCSFDIYSKDSEVANTLHERFPDARVEDPEFYF